jgi:hypothetical protein
MKTPKPDQLSERPTEHSDPSHEEIAQRAHQLWEQRGKPHGSPEEDWLLAEHELRQRSDTHGDTPAAQQDSTA